MSHPNRYNPSVPTDTSQPAAQLRLTLLQGPGGVGEAWVIREPAVCGRSERAEIRLDNPRVSRRHVSFVPTPDGWMLRDHSSHGTLLNAVAIDPDQPVPVREGDRIGVGPYVLGIGKRAATATLMLSQDGSRRNSTISVTGRDRDTRAVSADRLRMLFETAGEMRRASSAHELADAVLARLLAMTGFEWGAVLDYAGGDAAERAIITDRNRPGGASVSASLLRAAQAGTASLLGEPDLRTSESIIGSRTHDAIASTVHVGEEPVWQLYLASGQGRSRPDPEAAMLVDAMVQFAGLLLSDRQREDLAVRQTQFRRDIEFAREVQTRLLGRTRDARADGLAGMLSIPGRGVAGDLVGFRGSPSGRRYFFIGDVSGKGPAAAMLMAATQAYIASLIDHDLDLEELLPRLNAYLAQVSASSEFVTLWIGLSDPQRGIVRYADAGHGYAFRLCDGEVTSLTDAGGPPVGILADAVYEIAEMQTPKGCCILLCSDGVVEQQNAEGEELGTPRLHELLTKTPAAELEQAIIGMLSTHAGSTSYSDDVTLATIEF
jgi:serine phosphatase RsbU (regulator of sigma subunit)/pSer/pThr/pTyr-binding forkhead associated (FHA) protein